MHYSIIKIVLWLAIANLIACASPEQLSKEQLLYKSIAELEARFEERKLARIVEYVSADYTDKTGRQLGAIKRAIQMQLMRHKTLHVFSMVKDINWHDDDNVSVNIAAAMGGKPMESASILTSMRADMIKFKVDFVLEDEVYKVKSATWKWATPVDFL